MDHSVAPRRSPRLGEGSHGSILNGNYAPNRLTSARKPTTVVFRDASNRISVANQQFISFDGYFTALYERELTEILGQNKICLKMSVKGSAQIELWHQSAWQTKTLYQTQAVSSQNSFSDISISFHLHSTEGQIGRWYFVLRSTGSSNAVLESACWAIESEPVQECRPEFIICTFKREEQVSRNVNQLSALLRANSIKFGITVVDNAKTLRRDNHWGKEINLIQQRNLGGAGGFGRGIHECLKSNTATHIILLDDDADIDAVSILRMLNLMRLTDNKDIFFGGMQLDAFSPRYLADAGAFWHPQKFEKVRGRMKPSDLAKDETKAKLCYRYHTNFNGWWLFGGSIDGFRQTGMPLPCFVHLDDVEYGLRINQNGGKTLTIPGIAIWHEPYYAKLEGWFAYYNIRNELIRVCLQSKSPPNVFGLLNRLRKRHRNLLMANQYGSAALVSLAMEHFLEGPDLFAQRDPEENHAVVMRVYSENHKNYARKDTSSASGAFKFGRPLKGLKLIWAHITLHGHLYPSSQLKSEPLLFNNCDDVTYRALNRRRLWGYFDPQLPYLHTFSIDKKLFWRCVKAMCGASARFLFLMNASAIRWKREKDSLTSPNFWNSIRFD